MFFGLALVAWESSIQGLDVYIVGDVPWSFITVQRQTRAVELSKRSLVEHMAGVV